MKPTVYPYFTLSMLLFILSGCAHTQGPKTTVFRLAQGTIIKIDPVVINQLDQIKQEVENMANQIPNLSAEKQEKAIVLYNQIVEVHQYAIRFLEQKIVSYQAGNPIKSSSFDLEFRKIMSDTGELKTLILSEDILPPPQSSASTSSTLLQRITTEARVLVLGSFAKAITRELYMSRFEQRRPSGR